MRHPIRKAGFHQVPCRRFFSLRQKTTVIALRVARGLEREPVYFALAPEQSVIFDRVTDIVGGWA